jgi:hypothetical protein
MASTRTTPAAMSGVDDRFGSDGGVPVGIDDVCDLAFDFFPMATPSYRVPRLRVSTGVVVLNRLALD